MNVISIDDVTSDMEFVDAKPYSTINVRAGKTHMIVRDSEKNDVGIVYPGKSKEGMMYGFAVDYFFWKEYNTTRVIKSRSFRIPQSF